jgi:hypothetical protein
MVSQSWILGTEQSSEEGTHVDAFVRETWRDCGGLLFGF